MKIGRLRVDLGSLAIIVIWTGFGIATYFMSRLGAAVITTLFAFHVGVISAIREGWIRLEKRKGASEDV